MRNASPPPAEVAETVNPPVIAVPLAGPVTVGVTLSRSTVVTSTSASSQLSMMALAQSAAVTSLSPLLNPHDWNASTADPAETRTGLATAIPSKANDTNAAEEVALAVRIPDVPLTLRFTGVVVARTFAAAGLRWARSATSARRRAPGSTAIADRFAWWAASRATAADFALATLDATAPVGAAPAG